MWLVATVLVQLATDVVLVVLAHVILVQVEPAVGENKRPK